MANRKIFILSTRPVGEAAMAKALKHDMVIEEISFIKTEEDIDGAKSKKIKELSDQKISVVFTSMNAVEAVGKIVSGTEWKIFCIGNTTKKLVEKYFGEKNITGTADNASLLAEKIISPSAIKKIVFFCGDQRREELPQKLKENKIEVEEIEVYKTLETPQQLSKEYDAVLFFSPSAVKSFFSKNKIRSATKLFAIGDTTAKEINNFTDQSIIIADKPGKENLIDLAIKHFSKSHIL